MTDTNLPATKEKEQPPDLMVGPKGFLVPNSLDTQWRMASIISKSGLAPKNMEAPATLFTAIQLGSEVGLAPMQAVQSIAVINGRPTIWGDAQLALVKAHSEYEWIKERVEGTGNNMTAICEVKRYGEPVSTMQTYSVADAQLAGLWGKPGPWKQYPKRMLQMRARGFALRDAFPDVLKGLAITREEAIDMALDETGTYQAPEVKTVQDAVDKAKKGKEPVREDGFNVDPQTGEIKDVWHRDNWIRLRTAGFMEYVKDNFSTLELQPADVQEAVKQKWEGLYGEEPFPGTEPEEEAIADPFTEPEKVPEEPVKVACPDREGVTIFANYCEEECNTREGCPAWD